MKEIIFDEKARQSILRGVEVLSKAVKTTLGPSGRNVVIEHVSGSPTVTKDGVSVAKQIELDDPFENIGAQLIKEVSSKTNDIAGDGTTTATVLAEAIYKEGLKNVTAGANPILLQRGINKASNALTEQLSKNAKPVKSSKDINQVALVSANWDIEIADLITEAMERVGKDGTITVVGGNGYESSLSVVEGMEFNQGFLSPFFITDQDRQICDFKDSYILLYENKISSMKEVLPVLQMVAKTKKPLLIICDSIDGDALSTLVVNNNRGTIQSVAIKAPNFGDNRKNIMEDIACLTGGKYICQGSNLSLESITLDDLGVAEGIVVSENDTTIFKGGGDPSVIKQRVQNLRNRIQSMEVSHDRSFLQTRLAKLTSGVAIISVGAKSESEMSERKDRVDDALHATRSAVEEGIVAGGGVALIRAFQDIRKTFYDHATSEDEKTGMGIVAKAIEAPLKQLVLNAGREGALVVSEVQKQPPEFGYNVLDDTYVNMVDSGIVDPKKVTRSALQHACSVAGLLLTTECIITKSNVTEINI